MIHPAQSILEYKARALRWKWRLKLISLFLYIVLSAYAAWYLHQNRPDYALFFVLLSLPQLGQYFEKIEYT